MKKSEFLSRLNRVSKAFSHDEKHKHLATIAVKSGILAGPKDAKEWAKECGIYFDETQGINEIVRIIDRFAGDSQSATYLRRWS